MVQQGNKPFSQQLGQQLEDIFLYVLDAITDLSCKWRARIFLRYILS